MYLDRARVQQEYYNKWRKLGREKNIIEIDGIQPSFAVISFDFAQQVHYPSSARTVGPAYFKTARKCSLFGVHDKKTGVQRNYLIEEEDIIRKGANCVVSLLHHYFSTIDAELLIMFADNCAGQNKNNTVAQYLSWRVVSGLNLRIELNFILAGHTKFGPDRNFDVLKFAYSRTDIDCLEDLIACVNASSHNGFNEAMPTILNGSRNVYWSKWDDFLNNFFKKFPGISMYHQFKYYPDKN